MKKVELPVINLRDVVFFPGMECNLYLGREFTIKAMKHAKKTTKSLVVVVTQKSCGEEKPLEKNDAYSVGTICKILQSIELTDGTMKAVLQATDPVKVLKLEIHDGVRYAVGKKIDRAKAKKSLIDEKTKKEALKLLVRWNPEIALNEETAKFESIKRENGFDKFLALALDISSSPGVGRGSHRYEKSSPKTLKLINTYISKRQKILEQPNRKKQFSMLLSILKEELHLVLN
jgi:ATP-dependent Lon protease